MTAEKIMQIINDTAYIRTGGTDEELNCANYLKNVAEELGIPARLEDFTVNLANIKNAHLFVDGKEIECT